MTDADAEIIEWVRLAKGDLPGHPFRGNQHTTQADLRRIELHHSMGNEAAASAVMTKGGLKKACKAASKAHFAAKDAWQKAAVTPAGSPERAAASQASLEAQQAARVVSDVQNGIPYEVATQH